MLGIGGRGGKHSTTLDRSRVVSLERKKLSTSPLEVQSDCALASNSSNGLSGSSSSSVNKLVERSEISSSEVRKNESESNNESDASITPAAIRSKMKNVKLTTCRIMMIISIVTSKQEVRGKQSPHLILKVPVPCGILPNSVPCA